jgi:hypothetical protein
MTMPAIVVGMRFLGVPSMAQVAAVFFAWLARRRAHHRAARPVRGPQVGKRGVQFASFLFTHGLHHALVKLTHLLDKHFMQFAGLFWPHDFLDNRPHLLKLRRRAEMLARRSVLVGPILPRSAILTSFVIRRRTVSRRPVLAALVGIGTVCHPFGSMRPSSLVLAIIRRGAPRAINGG